MKWILEITSIKSTRIKSRINGSKFVISFASAATNVTSITDRTNARTVLSVRVVTVLSSIHAFKASKLGLGTR